ncbi:zinc metalloprotease HtpX [Veillonella intestinalis]|uniref:zinc metalloprotease HtpX n=1 Tax=Veillonella intestinalis TaxID=2941341 RepID=UPI002040DAC7|nr:zinc metalloprotease HtpX [Veillonella intestinalis]
MNNVKTAVLLALMTGLLMVIGQLVAGRTGLLTMFIISMGMNLFSYWNSDKLVLSMYNARQISATDNPELYNMVASLAKRGNLPMPKVYIIESKVPNAFATGRNPEHGAVAVTTGIMELLTDDEIEGVLAHELTHIKHRDTLISTIAASIAGVITMIANMMQFFAIFGRSDDREGANPIAMLATIILAPIAAALIQMAISRSREYLADEGGAEMSGKPLSLASALGKIDYYAKYGALPTSESQVGTTAHMFIINPLSNVKDFTSSLFSTHPSTVSRIEKLKELAARMR